MKFLQVTGLKNLILTTLAIRTAPQNVEFVFAQQDLAFAWASWETAYFHPFMLMVLTSLTPIFEPLNFLIL